MALESYSLSNWTNYFTSLFTPEGRWNLEGRGGVSAGGGDSF